MRRQQKHFYEFGGFSLDVSNRLLLRDGDPVALHPKVFDTLLLLVERRDEVLGKDELMRQLWPDSFVEESNLSQNIYVLRKTLGQESGGAEFIRTVPKRGYKFVADITEVGGFERQLISEEHASGRIVSAGAMDDATDGYDSLMVRQKMDAMSLPMSSIVSAEPTSRWRMLALSLAAFTLLAATGLVIYRFFSRRDFANSFRHMKITQLTFTDKVFESAISPDGKYVAYVLNNADRNSIFLRQLASGSDLQIVQPAQANLAELVFSPDGNFVYYLMAEKGTPPYSLQRVPVIGGQSTKLVDDVWTPVTFSPEGDRFAFIRRSPPKGEDALVVVASENRTEQILALRKRPDFFLSGAAWSPDGKVIACGAGSFTGGLYHTVIGVRTTDGSQTPITERKWARVDHLAWFPDGSGLAITATERGETSHQIWWLSYPSGGAERITNDLNEYHGVSLTADARTLATAQTETVSNLWVRPNNNPPMEKNSVQITSGTGGDGFKGVSWTPDGRIVYSSGVSGNMDIWLSEADGSGKKQLTFDKGRDIEPSVSPDGGFVVFVSYRTGNSQVWRMKIDGSEQVQLTDGFDGHVPQVSPDGSWVVYISLDGGRLSLWRVPFSGGEERQLTDKFSILPSISPDGKLIACHYREAPNAPFKIAIIPFDGGLPVQTFDVLSDSGSPVKWTSDGRALVYSIKNAGTSNLWLVQRAGGSPVQLTNFKDGIIFWFDLSSDGKQLVLARGSLTADAVLLRNLQ